MRIIYIEWADAMQNYEGWQTAEEAKQWAQTDDWIIKQVGYVIEENNQYLLLGANKSKDTRTGEDQFGMIFKIPKPWIKYVETISVKQKESDGQ